MYFIKNKFYNFNLKGCTATFILFFFSTSIVLFGQTSKKPNIVIILADDLGWSDLGCYGSTFYETPYLDQLAADGIQFMYGYATSPVCSPSRASLMTGKYPVKTGITDWIKGRQADGKAKPYEKMIAKPTAYNLSLDEKTIAERAMENGYKTFFAGKWHLGENEASWPENQGFMINKGGTSKGSPTGVKNDTTGGFFTPYQNPRLNDGPPGEYLTDRLADECLKFIDQEKNSPFLMVYSLYAVHNPLQAPTTLVNKYKQKLNNLALKPDNIFRKDEPWMAYENGWKQRIVQSHPVYAAMVENMDLNIGKILKKLKELGLSENTLVVFTSDNGGLSTAEGSPTTNYTLRAGKGWLYEGGIRVPFILRWPGKIAAGQKSDIPIHTADIFATCMGAFDMHKIKNLTIDGKNILDLLEKPKEATKRSHYWHYPHYSNQGGKPGSAILQYPYKLIYNHENTSTELYHLKNDPGEAKNLSQVNSKITLKLYKQLQNWLKNVNATYPDNNPNYVK
jgi:arylsulfatase A-like enzyme